VSAPERKQRAGIDPTFSTSGQEPATPRARAV